MHVEFCGIPGAGKTTYCSALFAEARRREFHLLTFDEAVYGVIRKSSKSPFLERLVHQLPYRVGRRFMDLAPTHNNRKLVAAFQRFVIQHPELCETIYLAQSGHASQSTNMGLLVFLWLFEFLSKYQLVVEGRGPADSMVIDEGFVQRIVTLFAYDAGEKNIPGTLIEDYVDRMPRPGAVVYVKADPQLCYERMEERGFPFRLEKYDRERRLDVLQRASECIDKVLSRLARQSVEVMLIDNNANSKDLREMEARVLEKLVSERPSKR